MEERTSTRLILRKAKAGSEEATERLFERLLPYVRRNVRSRLGGGLQRRVDCMDIVQTVCIRLLRALPNVNYEGRRRFRMWVLTTVRNEINRQASHHTSAKRDVRREVALNGKTSLGAEHSAERDETNEELKENLLRAVARLPDDHRTIIFYRFQMDLSWKEVGRRMGRSEPAVKMLFQRACIKLRKQWHQKGSVVASAR